MRDVIRSRQHQCISLHHLLLEFVELVVLRADPRLMACVAGLARFDFRSFDDKRLGLRSATLGPFENDPEQRSRASCSSLRTPKNPYDLHQHLLIS